MLSKRFQLAIFFFLSSLFSPRTKEPFQRVDVMKIENPGGKSLEWRGNG